MEKISFYLMQLIVENKDIERFKSLQFESFVNFPLNTSILFEDIYYEVSAEKHNDYVWFSFDYGRANPRDDKVTNIKNGDKNENKRTEDEAELLHQLFFLYSFKKNILYITTSKKQRLIQTLLKQELHCDYTIKSFFKTDEELISILKNITKVSFTEVANLFNQESRERKALIDLTGTDAPVKFTIEAKYPKNSNIILFIQRLFSAQRDMSLKDLVICGVDNDDFNIVYNTDTFSRKIEIDCSKEENGKFNVESVKNNLLKFITE